MPRAVLESACDGNGLSKRGVSAQVVLARFADLAVGYKIGLLEVFENDRDDGIVENLAISAAQSFRQLRNRLPLHLHVADAAQGYKPVRLHENGSLIELGAQFKIQIERVPRSNLVARLPRLKLRVGRAGRRLGRDVFGNPLLRLGDGTGQG